MKSSNDYDSCQKIRFLFDLFGLIYYLSISMIVQNLKKFYMRGQIYLVYILIMKMNPTYKIYFRTNNRIKLAARITELIERFIVFPPKSVCTVVLYTLGKGIHI